MRGHLRQVISCIINRKFSDNTLQCAWVPLRGPAIMGDPSPMTRHVSNASSPWLDWHGLGGWNIYFLAKFALLWAGYLNFHPLINLVFAAFLIFPLPRAGLRRIRHWLALPVGVGIFYHDTWLPGMESIRAQGAQVFSFTLDYWLELLGRFINWEMVGAGFVMLTLYLFIAQWLRFTPWILLALLWLWLSPLVGDPFASQAIQVVSTDKGSEPAA